MPQQLSSSLELSPRRGHLEGHILLHLMPSFCPSGRTEGIEGAENKRGAYRDSEELGKGTKVRRQSVWEPPRQKSPIYDQPPNDAGLRRGNWDGLSSSDWSPQPLGLQQNCLPDPAGRGCAGLGYTTHRVRQTEGRLKTVLRVGPFSFLPTEQVT